MIGHFNTIDALHAQIDALLDLMMCADKDCTDIHSTKMAAEMCLTILDELKIEVDMIYEEYKKLKEQAND